MRLLIIIDQFSFGGGARVVSRLLDGFVASGHNVILATKLKSSEKMYPIPNAVSIVDFVSKDERWKCLQSNTIWNHWLGIKACRQLIKNHNPNVIIAEMAGIFMWTYLGSLGTGIPVIAHDHTSFLRKLKPLYNFIRFHLYKKADALVILSERDKSVLGKKFPYKHVIYNPLPFDPINYSSYSQERRKSILCVGRFDVWDVKGFDIIVEIFGKLSSKHPNWKLEFAGWGSEESVNYIKELVRENGIENRTIFHGQIRNIKKLYQEVKIFALPSRVEGLPMGLMEAMSQGCACVAFEVGGATNEMITQDISGFVVEDGEIDTFSERIHLLMSNEPAIQKIGLRAIEESKKFSLEQISKQWDTLLNNVSK